MKDQQQGQGGQRQQARSRRQRSPLETWMIRAALAFALVALVLGGRYLWDWHKNSQANDAFKSMYHVDATPAPSATAVETIADTTPLPDQEQALAAPPADPIPSPAVEAQATWPPLRQASGERFVSLLRHNKDVVGWLRYAPFYEIDFAVVQRDNSFYMDHAVDGKKNLAGAVFLDEENSISPLDKNLILHGHNMKNGTMFGRLARLLDPDTLRANPLFSFDTLYQDAVYVPYAVTVFSVSPGDPYFFQASQPNFASEEQMGAYVTWLRRNSALQFPTEVDARDRLLTLITCHGPNDSERLAVALRQLRPGEEQAQLKLQLQTGIYKP